MTGRSGFFGSKAGSFTSFFSRTGHSPTSSPMGEASIHGGSAGNFRQVCAARPSATAWGVHILCCCI